MRPFSSYYAPYNWRSFLDFGTGQIGNWATHCAGPVHTALQLGAPTSLERISVTGESKWTYPVSATVRLQFPARGAMPPVTVYYHEAAVAGASDAYRVPGMEKETILPPPNNLSDKGRLMTESPHARHRRWTATHAAAGLRPLWRAQLRRRNPEC
jgi:hypothetical protein